MVTDKVKAVQVQMNSRFLSKTAKCQPDGIAGRGGSAPRAPRKVRAHQSEKYQTPRRVAVSCGRPFFSMAVGGEKVDPDPVRLQYIPPRAGCAEWMRKGRKTRSGSGGRRHVPKPTRKGRAVDQDRLQVS